MLMICSSLNRARFIPAFLSAGHCVWQHNFGDFAEACAAISKWINWYNADRPYQVLGYCSPRQFRGL
jgi:transposase InsO family protein